MTYKALFFNVPGYGHVNPSLPLVAELARRGHAVTYFITPAYRARVEAAGAEVRLYRTIADDFFDPMIQEVFHPQVVACELLKKAEEILPELLETARAANPDYVVFDCMCPWGYWIARVLDVPAISSFSLMPPIIRAFLNKSTWRFMLPMVFRDFGKALEANRRSRALGKEYGVRPLGQVSILSAEGDLSISYTSAEFVPFAGDVSPTFRFVGRRIEEERDVDPHLFDRVGDRPLVYISMGTVFNKEREVVETFIRAFEGRDEAVMITTGRQFTPESFGSLPENISIHPWLPQIAVLKRAALFVSHGGLNSVHDGLYFGVPMLLCPQQEEQTMNAGRVVDLGAGLLLRKEQFNVEALRAGADRLLTDPRFRIQAEKIGKTLRTPDRLREAVDEIEDLVAKRR